MAAWTAEVLGTTTIPGASWQRRRPAGGQDRNFVTTVRFSDGGTLRPLVRWLQSAATNA